VWRFLSQGSSTTILPFTLKFSRAEDLEAWCGVLTRNGAVDGRAAVPVTLGSVAGGGGYGSASPALVVAPKVHKTKRFSAVLFPDRVDIFTAPDAAAAAAADAGDALGANIPVKPEASFPFTRRSTVAVSGSSVTVDVQASPRRGVDAGPFTLTFDSPDVAAAWAAAITSCVCGPLGCVFGGNLAVITERSPYVVPAVLYTCVQYLKMRGINEEGLLRIPGAQDAVAALRRAADAQVVQMGPLLRDAHTVAGVVKLFLRELSDPLIPFDRYAEFTALNTKNGQNLDAAALRVRDLVASLPRANRDTLAYLVHFLVLVARNGKVNKMESKNCAMVLAPGVMRVDESAGKVENPQMLAEMLLEQECLVKLMIDYYPVVFPRGTPYL